MSTERRKPPLDAAPASYEMTRGLSAPQLTTLAELEQFGWRLGFVRRPLFQAVVPVVFSPDRVSYAVLRTDGSVDERPDIKVRLH